MSYKNATCCSTATWIRYFKSDINQICLTKLIHVRKEKFLTGYKLFETTNWEI